MAHWEMERVTLGIFGGTFNPIHIGHLWLAQEVGMRLQFTRVIFVPAGIPPHKADAISELARLEMVKLATRDNPFFAVSSVEIESSRISYTYHTLQLLKRQYDEPLAFIIGSDNVRQLPTWYRWRDILEICDLAIGERPGYGIEVLDELKPLVTEETFAKLRQNFVTLPPNFGVSSSVIRERYAKNQSNRYLVPEPVNQYILRHQLYSLATSLTPDKEN